MWSSISTEIEVRRVKCEIRKWLFDKHLAYLDIIAGSRQNKLMLKVTESFLNLSRKDIRTIRGLITCQDHMRCHHLPNYRRFCQYTVAYSQKPREHN